MINFTICEFFECFFATNKNCQIVFSPIRKSRTIFCPIPGLPFGFRPNAGLYFSQLGEIRLVFTAITACFSPNRERFYPNKRCNLFLIYKWNKSVKCALILCIKMWQIFSCNMQVISDSIIICLYIHPWIQKRRAFALRIVWFE